MPTAVTVEFALAPAVNGEVTCVLSNRMMGDGTTVETAPVVAVLEAGAGRANLYANDDPGTVPQATSWIFRAVLGGAAVPARRCVIAAAQAPAVNYADLQDVATVDQPAVTLVPGPPGPKGDPGLAGGLVTVAVQTAAYVAGDLDDVPCDTTSGPFAGTMPGATPGAHVRWTNVAVTGTAPVTLLCPGADRFVAPEAEPPVAAPGESLDCLCYVTGRWSLI